MKIVCMRHEDIDGMTVEELREAYKKLQDLYFGNRAKDSTNSSIPSSKDQKKPDKQSQQRSLRVSTGKASGGQKGHDGSTREQTRTPDHIFPCAPEHCSQCAMPLLDLISDIHSRRQEVDIPPIVPVITEYQQMVVDCPCGHREYGSFPAHITAPLQLGQNLRSMVTYLNISHKLPYQRLTQLIDDFVHLRISEGSVENILSYALAKAQPIQVDILAMIKEEKWIGGDETGTRVAGKRWWEWVWQNDAGSLYAIEPSRGYDVVKKHFGEDYQGTLLHDCWGAQNKTPAKQHQHCHPHYQRDLQLSVDLSRCPWAWQVQRLLWKSQRAQKRIWAERFSPHLRVQVQQSYEQVLDRLLTFLPVHPESLKLAKRLRRHREKIFPFLYDPDIPPDNNSSERAIRNAKLHAKISGGFRSMRGAQRHAVLLSFIETVKKQDRDVLRSIQELLQGTFVLRPSYT
jgi:transposase